MIDTEFRLAFQADYSYLKGPCYRVLPEYIACNLNFCIEALLPDYRNDFSLKLLQEQAAGYLYAGADVKFFLSVEVPLWTSAKVRNRRTRFIRPVHFSGGAVCRRYLTARAVRL